MDERLYWEKHADSICSKVSTEIGANGRIKPVVHELLQCYTMQFCPLIFITGRKSNYRGGL